MDKMRERFEKWYNAETGAKIGQRGRATPLVEGVAWRAWQAAQSVPVVGEVVAYMLPDGEIRHSCECTAGSFEVVYGYPLIIQPTHSISAAELERLRKDAERYRWLRSPSTYVGKVIDKEVGYEPLTDFGTGGYPIYEYRAGADLDQAIDAAIAGEKK